MLNNINVIPVFNWIPFRRTEEFFWYTNMPLDEIKFHVHK